MKLIVIALVVVTGVGHAQTSDLDLELRPFVGAWIPTGDFRIDFDRGRTAGLSAAVQPARHWLFALSASYTATTNNYAFMTKHGTGIWQYGAGFEIVPAAPADVGLQLRPFVGLGGGFRTYRYDDQAGSSSSCGEGYGGIGADLLSIRFGARLEARDYVSCFKSPLSGSTLSRNNLAASLALMISL